MRRGGAGCSGLSTAKRLKDHDIDYDHFEMSDDVGGNWYFRNPNGRSSVYESLHIDTSTQRLQFEDFPAPPSYPDLVVANGHHWSPRLPDYPGHFEGELIHSHAYISPFEHIEIRGKRVIVVGMGNSAMDIASELSTVGWRRSSTSRRAAACGCCRSTATAWPPTR